MKCDLSDENLSLAKAKFFEADQDGSGTIDREEVRSERSIHAVSAATP